MSFRGVGFIRSRPTKGFGVSSSKFAYSRGHWPFFLAGEVRDSRIGLDRVLFMTTLVPLSRHKTPIIFGNENSEDPEKPLTFRETAGPTSGMI